jgi:predicted transcriptional regulator of viral defense system
MKVIRYLLQNRSKNNNIVFGTIREIAQKCEVGTQCVQQTLNALIKSNFMVRIQQGVYQINPDMIFKGKHNARLNILLQYRKNKNGDK